MPEIQCTSQTFSPTPLQAKFTLHCGTFSRTLSTPSYKNIQLITDATPVARIVLNRPDKRNALSLATMTELLQALSDVESSQSRVVILESTGHVFSSGHDLSELRTTDKVKLDEVFGTCATLMQRLHAIPQPVIAKVNGFATAAGCQLVASCDLAVASTSSKFSTPGVNIGIFCSTPAVPITRAVGGKRGMKMLLTGDPIDAQTALEWGLVNDIVPPAEIDAFTQALAAKIATASPITVSIGKRTYWQQEGKSEQDAYRIATEAMVRNARTGDAQEGFTAFFEKRKPQWTGK